MSYFPSPTLLNSIYRDPLKHIQSQGEIEWPTSRQTIDNTSECSNPSKQKIIQQSLYHNIPPSSPAENYFIQKEHHQTNLKQQVKYHTHVCPPFSQDLAHTEPFKQDSPTTHNNFTYFNNKSDDSQYLIDLYPRNTYPSIIEESIPVSFSTNLKSHSSELEDHTVVASAEKSPEPVNPVSFKTKKNHTVLSSNEISFRNHPIQLNVYHPVTLDRTNLDSTMSVPYTTTILNKKHPDKHYNYLALEILKFCVKRRRRLALDTLYALKAHIFLKSRSRNHLLNLESLSAQQHHTIQLNNAQKARSIYTTNKLLSSTKKNRNDTLQQQQQPTLTNQLKSDCILYPQYKHSKYDNLSSSDNINLKEYETSTLKYPYSTAASPTPFCELKQSLQYKKKTNALKKNEYSFNTQLDQRQLHSQGKHTNGSQYRTMPMNHTKMSSKINQLDLKEGCRVNKLNPAKEYSNDPLLETLRRVAVQSLAVFLHSGIMSSLQLGFFTLRQRTTVQINPKVTTILNDPSISMLHDNEQSHSQQNTLHKEPNNKVLHQHPISKNHISADQGLSMRMTDPYNHHLLPKKNSTDSAKKKMNQTNYPLTPSTDTFSSSLFTHTLLNQLNNNNQENMCSLQLSKKQFATHHASLRTDKPSCNESISEDAVQHLSALKAFLLKMSNKMKCFERFFYYQEKCKIFYYLKYKQKQLKGQLIAVKVCSIYLSDTQNQFKQIHNTTNFSSVSDLSSNNHCLMNKYPSDRLFELTKSALNVSTIQSCQYDTLTAVKLNHIQISPPIHQNNMLDHLQSNQIITKFQKISHVLYSTEKQLQGINRLFEKKLCLSGFFCLKRHIYSDNCLVFKKNTVPLLQLKNNETFTLSVNDLQESKYLIVHTFDSIIHRAVLRDTIYYMKIQLLRDSYKETFQQQSSMLSPRSYNVDPNFEKRLDGRNPTKNYISHGYQHTPNGCEQTNLILVNKLIHTEPVMATPDTPITIKNTLNMITTDTREVIKGHVPSLSDQSQFHNVFNRQSIVDTNELSNGTINYNVPKKHTLSNNQVLEQYYKHIQPVDIVPPLQLENNQCQKANSIVSVMIKESQSIEEIWDVMRHFVDNAIHIGANMLKEINTIPLKSRSLKSINLDCMLHNDQKVDKIALSPQSTHKSVDQRSNNSSEIIMPSETNHLGVDITHIDYTIHHMASLPIKDKKPHKLIITDKQKNDGLIFINGLKRSWKLNSIDNHDSNWQAQKMILNNPECQIDQAIRESLNIHSLESEKELLTFSELSNMSEIPKPLTTNDTLIEKSFNPVSLELLNERDYSWWENELPIETRLRQGEPFIKFHRKDGKPSYRYIWVNFSDGCLHWSSKNPIMSRNHLHSYSDTKNVIRDRSSLFDSSTDITQFNDTSMIIDPAPPKKARSQSLSRFLRVHRSRSTDLEPLPISEIPLNTIPTRMSQSSFSSSFFSKTSQTVPTRRSHSLPLSTVSGIVYSWIHPPNSAFSVFKKYVSGHGKQLAYCQNCNRSITQKKINNNKSYSIINEDQHRCDCHRMMSSDSHKTVFHKTFLLVFGSTSQQTNNDFKKNPITDSKKRKSKKRSMTCVLQLTCITDSQFYSWFTGLQRIIKYLQHTPVMLQLPLPHSIWTICDENEKNIKKRTAQRLIWQKLRRQIWAMRSQLL